MGITAALVFANLGAAYGTAKSGKQLQKTVWWFNLCFLAVGISSMGVMNHESVMKNIIPVVMAGVLGIYGLITSAILVQQISKLSSLLHVLSCVLKVVKPLLAILLTLAMPTSLLACAAV